MRFLCLFLAAALIGVGHAQVTTVGIVGFRDESGGTASAEIRQQAAAALQRSLNVVYKDTIVARGLAIEPDRTVDELATAGKRDGLAFVVRGGLLPIGAGSAQLYADVISVETRTVTTFRAEGEATDVDGALSAAIAKLSTSIHGLIVATTGAPTPTTSSAIPAGTIAADDAGSREADRDEELWQLVAQAESMLSDPSAISSGTLNSIRRALERLNSALEAKAAVVSRGGDTSNADQDVAAHAQELQSALTRATDEATRAQEAGTPFEQPSAERKNIAQSIGEYVGEAANTLQRILDLTAQWKGATGGPGPGPMDVLHEEITGGVTEEGEPVDDVTITDPETGETTTTDANGSYVLKAVPGRTSRLVLTRKGKAIGTAQVVVQRGRPVVADFELTRNAAVRAGLKVRPSTVMVKPRQSRAGSTGTLAGVVRDPRGRPLPRALVCLRGVAVARTDSLGRYAFIGVPAGARQLTIYRPGMKPQSMTVQIAARQTNRSGVSMAAIETKTIPPATAGPTMKSKPEGSTGVRALPPTGGVRGQIVDAKSGMPLPRAVVSLPGTAGAETNDRGGFGLGGLKPGTYQVIVKRTGYADGSANLTIRAGEIVTLNLRLTPRAPMQIRKTPGKPAG